MEAVTILKNDSNNHRVMQIDPDLLADNEKQLEDVYDSIAVELRKISGHNYASRDFTAPYTSNPSSLPEQQFIL